MYMNTNKIVQRIVTNSEKLNFSEGFYGFKIFGKTMGAYWWLYIWIFIWTFITELFIGLLGLLNVSIIVLLGGLAALLFILNRYISYSMIWFIICDDENKRVIDAMNLSKIITKDNILHLFLLKLSFIG